MGDVMLPYSNSHIWQQGKSTPSYIFSHPFHLEMQGQQTIERLEITSKA